MTGERFKLQPQDRTNPLWMRLEAHMRKQLAELRPRNDAHLPPKRTADIRGRIAQLKELLALANEPKTPQT